MIINKSRVIRYGDDAHLDSTLEALGLKLPQKKFPKLLSITQEDEDGELYFSLSCTLFFTLYAHKYIYIYIYIYDKYM